MYMLLNTFHKTKSVNQVRFKVSLVSSSKHLRKLQSSETESLLEMKRERESQLLLWDEHLSLASKTTRDSHLQKMSGQTFSYFSEEEQVKRLWHTVHRWGLWKLRGRQWLDRDLGSEERHSLSSLCFLFYFIYARFMNFFLPTVSLAIQ